MKSQPLTHGRNVARGPNSQECNCRTHNLDSRERTRHLTRLYTLSFLPPPPGALLSVISSLTKLKGRVELVPSRFGNIFRSKRKVSVCFASSTDHVPN